MTQEITDIRGSHYYTSTPAIGNEYFDEQNSTLISLIKVLDWLI